MNNNPLLFQELNLDPFGKDALYRALRIIGENRHTILHHLLFILKIEFDFGLDMVFMDWTSTQISSNTDTAETTDQTVLKSPLVSHMHNEHNFPLDSPFNQET